MNRLVPTKSAPTNTALSLLVIVFASFHNHPAPQGHQTSQLTPTPSTQPRKLIARRYRTGAADRQRSIVFIPPEQTTSSQTTFNLNAVIGSGHWIDETTPATKPSAYRSFTPVATRKNTSPPAPPASNGRHHRAHVFAVRMKAHCSNIPMWTADSSQFLHSHSAGLRP